MALMVIFSHVFLSNWKLVEAAKTANTENSLGNAPRIPVLRLAAFSYWSQSWWSINLYTVECPHFFKKSNSNSYEALAALNRDEFLLPSPVNQLLASLVSWTRRRISEVFASGQDCHRKPLNVIYWMNLSTYTLIVKLVAFPFQTFQNIACFPFPNISDYEFISGCHCPASKDPPHSELSSLLDNLFPFFLVLPSCFNAFPCL